MNTQKSLYSTRITKVKLEYLKKYYPNIQTEELLDYAGILTHELEDRGHWLNQEQVDRFSEICLKLTGDKDFHRKTGRYMALSENLAHLKQYTLGFLSPKTAYLLMGMILPMLSRTVSVKTKNLGPRKVEITVQPNTGVQERLFQCEHRTGCFEALGQFFTGQLADIEHPQCIHRGDKVCQYVLSWEDSPSAKWKKLGAAMVLAGLMSAPFLLYFLSFKTAGLCLLGFAVLSLCFFVYHLRQKQDELSHSLRIQGEVAKDQIDEVNLRYNNLMLVQEIAQITSDRLDVVLLIDAVMKAMKRRLDFDRGMAMLADEKAAKLYFVAGYGYGNELKEQIQELEFNLTNKEAKGIFVKVFHQQKPLLVENIEDILEDLSPRSSRFATAAEAKSIICVPIVYERNSLGILVVDKIRSNRPLTQSDIGLLNGIAAHLAASIVIAQSFDKLRESERKYRDLVENAHSIILRRDMDGHITFFNEFAQTLFGYMPENILGKSVLGTLLPDSEEERADLIKTNELFKQNPETRVVKESEHQINSGETLWIAWTLKSVVDHEGNPEEILCIGNDITQIKRNEAENKQLADRLHRAEKMEALGALAGGVAHDLNNVLAGVIGYPDLLLAQLPRESPLRETVLNIKKSGEKGSAIVQDLLTMARRGVSVSETVNLNHVVREYMSSPEHQLLQDRHTQVRFETALNEKLFNTRGSPVHLSKTLMNLVNNAAESITGQGRVVVRTENSYLDQPVRGYDHVQKGNYVVLRVEDTGAGIQPDDLSRIFEPFYTRKKMGRSGTGLGMAVVWGTIVDHNGYIDVQSRLGHGTTFFLYFPATPDRLKQSKDTIAWKDLQGKGQTILVVDDLEEQREMAQSMLETLGYTVNTVSSGEEALSFIREHSVDLMVLDMIMDPGINGLETYRAALQICPEQKAILVSGFSNNHQVKEARGLGVSISIKKPYTLETIGAAIKDGLNES